MIGRCVDAVWTMSSCRDDPQRVFSEWHPAINNELDNSNTVGLHTIVQLLGDGALTYVNSLQPETDHELAVILES